MKRFLVMAILAAATPASAQYFGPRDLDALPSTPPTAVASYGSDPAQVADLRVPAGKGPFPVAVILHGGCFVAPMADRRNTAGMASDLVRHGVATLNVEYRRLGNGGGWPATFLDVGSAIDHLRMLAKPHALDLSRVVVLGHSAGAPLAAWAVGRPRLPRASTIRGSDPLPVKAAIAVDGPLDLARWNGPDADVCGAPVVARLLGGAPSTQPSRYRETSPIEMLPLGAPVYVVPSEIVDGQEAADYAARARKAGDTVTVVSVGDANHFQPMGPGQPGYDMVRSTVLAALGVAAR
jgi:acetyl esterase/lipase